MTLQDAGRRFRRRIALRLDVDAAALDIARRVARSTAPLLIQGEAGVGKDRMARAIHAWSGRSSCVRRRLLRPPPAEDLEFELFGLSSQMPPTFRRPIAGGRRFATGELSCFTRSGRPALASAQAAAVHPRPGIRAGERRHVAPVDVRVIGTTTEDLSDAAHRSAFRPELLLAVDVVSIEIPPLRTRPDDIRLLADRYLAFHAHANRRPAVGFSPTPSTR